ncbi:hypothetical protein SUGI_1136060 [Cryptomeria japonica]|nr:hypothetical protein SUGI_1136060 [Cryptomeria japonica]
MSLSISVSVELFGVCVALLSVREELWKVGKYLWLMYLEAYDLSIQIGSAIRSCEVSLVASNFNGVLSVFLKVVSNSRHAFLKHLFIHHGHMIFKSST